MAVLLAAGRNDSAAYVEWSITVTAVFSTILLQVCGHGLVRRGTLEARVALATFPGTRAFPAGL